MRTVLLVVGSILLLPAAGRADEAEDILDKAIQATATSALRLNRLANVIRTDRGTLFLPEGPTTFERKAYLSGPERLRYEATLIRGGQKDSIIMAVSPAGAWQKAAGKVDPLFPALAQNFRDGDADVWGLITLLPLRQKGTKLRALPRVEIGKKEAVGLNVSRPGRSNAQLYFDVNSGQLLRVNVRVREAGLEVSREVDLFDYKDFAGVSLPTRMTVAQNARKIEEWTVQDYKFPDKLDEKMFAQPAAPK
jgi:hypothetical protein